MVFGGYLTNGERLELTRAVSEGGLLGAIPRQVLLAGIPPTFVAGLQVIAAPLDQFQLDVVEINRVEQMAEGIVPIRVLLQNVSEQLKLRGRTEAAVADRLLSRVTNVSGGVPALPDPAQLPEIVSNEVIVGWNDMVDLMFLSGGVELARAVARIAVPRFQDGQPVSAPRGGPWVAHGTAWLIAPGLAITNHHVVNARLATEAAASPQDLALQATNAKLEFGFDRQDDTVPGVTVAGLLATSTVLDYALLDLTDAPAQPIPRFAETPVALDATTRMAVNIVQHPRGEYKRVAVRNNLVVAADADTMRYYTDTDQGSSGSPVCDDRWRVVALHRGAKHAPGAKYQGKDEAYVNFGSQIQAILTDIRAHDPAVADRIAAGQPQ